jgi:hypothetical protein
MGVSSGLVGGGSAPPERKEGQRERSSGRDVPVADDGERWDRMAAAWCWRQRKFSGDGRMTTNLEQLDLLVFAEDKLGCLTPVRSVFPSVFDETRRVTVNLVKILKLS